MTTEAGRTFLSALETMDRLTPSAAETPVDWGHGILAIEQQARRAALDDVRRLLVSHEETDAVALVSLLATPTDSEAVG